MGSFYTNYTLRGPEPSTVASALTGRRALVSPLCGGCVVVFDEASDDQDLDLISGLAARLSSDLSCQVLSVLNHDDDILWYRLYASGRLSDEYNSSPGYFEPRAKPSSPLGGNAAVLCAAFGSRNVDEVERILRKPAVGIAAYAFAYERHCRRPRTKSNDGGTCSFMIGSVPKTCPECAIVKAVSEARSK